MSISGLIVFIYYTKYLGIDDEELMGNRSILLQEGLMSSFAVFMVGWILTYNLFL